MNALRFFINGFLIGLANIIPGMSGGTLALVLGIYERLIGALRNIGLSTLKNLLGVIKLKKAAFTAAETELRRIDFGFLALLGTGAIASILLTSKLIVYLLNDHHDPTYGFFSGLILTSILVPARMLKRCGVREILVLLIAVALVLSLSVGMSEKQLERVAYKSGKRGCNRYRRSENRFSNVLELRALFWKRGTGDFGDDSARHQRLLSDACPRCLFSALNRNKHLNGGGSKINQGCVRPVDVREFANHWGHRNRLSVRASRFYTLTELSVRTLSQPDNCLSYRTDARIALWVVALS